MRGRRGGEQIDEVLAADMKLLDELLDVLVRRGQHLNEEDLDKVLGPCDGARSAESALG